MGMSSMMSRGRCCSSPTDTPCTPSLPKSLPPSRTQRRTCRSLSGPCCPGIGLFGKVCSSFFRWRFARCPLHSWRTRWSPPRCRTCRSSTRGTAAGPLPPGTARSRTTYSWPPRWRFAQCLRRNCRIRSYPSRLRTCPRRRRCNSPPRCRCRCRGGSRRSCRWTLWRTCPRRRTHRPSTLSRCWFESPHRT